MEGNLKSQRKCGCIWILCMYAHINYTVVRFESMLTTEYYAYHSCANMRSWDIAWSRSFACILVRLLSISCTEAITLKMFCIISRVFIFYSNIHVNMFNMIYIKCLHSLRCSFACVCVFNSHSLRNASFSPTNVCNNDFTLTNSCFLFVCWSRTF